MHEHLKIFSGRANPALAESICDYLDIPLGQIQIYDFPDTETMAQVDEDVRGRDVFLVQPTCPPVNHNLMELLIMIDSFRRASAHRITAVIPYFGYARQDRKDVGRVPITAKLAANVLETAGADRVLAMDLHTAQIQGFFDVPVDHLHAAPVIDDYLLSLNVPPEDIVIVSPDEGGIKLCLPHQEKLGGDLAIVDKRRASATATFQANLIGGPVKGKTAILFDDMITTGGSILGAAKVLRHFGARTVLAVATHPVLCGAAVERLREAPVDEIIVTDTIPLPREKQLPHVRILSVASILGEAIRRIHGNESVSDLFR